MDLLEGDLALRCNFSTVDENLNVTDRRAGRIKTGQQEMEKDLTGIVMDDIEFIFQATQEHRGVLILRGPGLSAGVTDIDPHKLGPVHDCMALDESSKKAADLLNKYVKNSYEILKDHPVNLQRIEQNLPPANILLPRGAGLTVQLQSLKDRYGITSACIAGVALVKGVLRLVGADMIEVPGATGGADSDFDAKVKAGIEGLTNHDFVFINIKAPDLFGHDGDAKGKIECIERIDRAFGYVKENLPEETHLAICADHSTPVTIMDHTADPVPLCIYGEGCRVDQVEKFDEVSLAQGGLGRIVGQNLMNIVLDLANRREKFGA
jgi:2,3-bisphosphoglycerate-independent phosphoglycerate mutase